MATIPLPVADAFRLLLKDLACHLDQAELLAVSWEWEDQDVDTARELISELVFIIQQLLREHGVQDSGDCRTCSSAWPCPVITTIHVLVKDPERQLAALMHRNIAVGGEYLDCAEEGTKMTNLQSAPNTPAA